MSDDSPNREFEVATNAPVLITASFYMAGIFEIRFNKDTGKMELTQVVTPKLESATALILKQHNGEASAEMAKALQGTVLHTMARAATRSFAASGAADEAAVEDILASVKNSEKN